MRTPTQYRELRRYIRTYVQVFNCFLPPANGVAGRQCFQSCVFVILPVFRRSPCDHYPWHFTGHSTPKMTSDGGHWSTHLRFVSGLYASYWNAFLLPAATKLGQGNVFTGICDSVNRGGGLPQCMLGYHPPGTTTPPGADTPPREADSGIRSTSGRYSSHWNAFLFD